MSINLAKEDKMLHFEDLDSHIRCLVPSGNSESSRPLWRSLSGILTFKRGPKYYDRIEKYKREVQYKFGKRKLTSKPRLITGSNCEWSDKNEKLVPQIKYHDLESILSSNSVPTYAKQSSQIKFLELENILASNSIHDLTIPTIDNKSRNSTNLFEIFRFVSFRLSRANHQNNAQQPTEPPISDGIKRISSKLQIEIAEENAKKRGEEDFVSSPNDSEESDDDDDIFNLNTNIRVISRSNSSVSSIGSKGKVLRPHKQSNGNAENVPLASTFYRPIISPKIPKPPLPPQPQLQRRRSEIEHIAKRRYSSEMIADKKDWFGGGIESKSRYSCIEGDRNRDGNGGGEDDEDDEEDDDDFRLDNNIRLMSRTTSSGNNNTENTITSVGTSSDIDSSSTKFNRIPSLPPVDLDSLNILSSSKLQPQPPSVKDAMGALKNRRLSPQNRQFASERHLANWFAGEVSSEYDDHHITTTSHDIINIVNNSNNTTTTTNKSMKTTKNATATTTAPVIAPVRVIRRSNSEGGFIGDKTFKPMRRISIGETDVSRPSPRSPSHSSLHSTTQNNSNNNNNNKISKLFALPSPPLHKDSLNVGYYYAMKRHRGGSTNSSSSPSSGRRRHSADKVNLSYWFDAEYDDEHMIKRNEREEMKDPSPSHGFQTQTQMQRKTNKEGIASRRSNSILEKKRAEIDLVHLHRDRDRDSSNSIMFSDVNPLFRKPRAIGQEQQQQQEKTVLGFISPIKDECPISISIKSS